MCMQLYVQPIAWQREITSFQVNMDGNAISLNMIGLNISETGGYNHTNQSIEFK